MDPLEIAGFLFGVAGVWLTSRGSIWCFPTGLVNVIISLFLFYNHKLYSDAVQQGVYIILLSYGWYQWGAGKTGSQLPVVRLSLQLAAKLFAAGVVVATSMGYMFSRYTDADLPYLDASASALSFIAQFLIARKVIENWILWMVVNVVYIGIYFSKDMHLYVILFVIYLMLAVYGYLSWRKSLTHDNVR